MYKKLLIVALLISTGAMAKDAVVPDAKNSALAQSRKIFGGQKEDLYIPNANLAEALRELTNLPEEPVNQGDYVLISGCRPQSCMEKAAMVLDKSSKQLLAVGFVHFQCHAPVVTSDRLRQLNSLSLAVPSAECLKQPVYSSFLIRRDTSTKDVAAELVVAELLDGWAKKSGYQTHTVRIWPFK